MKRRVFAGGGKQHLRFLIDGVTVYIEEKCPAPWNEAGRMYWHSCGHVGVEALHVAARHGLTTRLRGPSPCVHHSRQRHVIELTAEQVRELLVRLDENMEVHP